MIAGLELGLFKLRFSGPLAESSFCPLSFFEVKFGVKFGVKLSMESPDLLRGLADANREGLAAVGTFLRHNLQEVYLSETRDRMAKLKLKAMKSMKWMTTTSKIDLESDQQVGT